MNIALVGFMGTGKSAVGKRLAKRLSWKFIDIDSIIEKSASLTIPEIFEQLGEEEFRNLERISIYGATRNNDQVISTGGGAFSDPDIRQWLLDNCLVVCLNASPETILKRVNRRINKRPLLASADDPLVTIQSLLKKRQSDYAQADIQIESSDQGLDAEVDVVYQAIQSYLKSGTK